VSRWLILAFVLTACRTVRESPTATGGRSPEAAVNAFLAAGKAQDLQAMAAIWGTRKGPARETMDRRQLEDREIVMVHMLCQDNSRIVGKTPGRDGAQIVRVEMTRGNNAVTVNFTTVEGPNARWYVEEFEIDKMLPVCR
jgi:hypothetical protein